MRREKCPSDEIIRAMLTPLIIQMYDRDIWFIIKRKLMPTQAEPLINPLHIQPFPYSMVFHHQHHPYPFIQYNITPNSKVSYKRSPMTPQSTTILPNLQQPTVLQPLALTSLTTLHHLAAALRQALPISLQPAREGGVGGFAIRGSTATTIILLICTMMAPSFRVAFGCLQLTGALLIGNE